ncbi:HNH endonuclease signature motif containing protein [Rudaeicoccus suwonensis]|uniref:Uncharacterized protein DUF222 n=1 Tax=Rudaeicoccus suwonensis TaxID=657409 RepID=A0A561ECM4_9MICO|nr:HNH endonuclease signature motif containing protein [Rudaeicoccus suwonensis]TWE13368.1 uncharacterized protein DUF222 [Rudaeicoccus suwonensis]
MFDTSATPSTRDELAHLCGQINDGHARLIQLMRQVIRDEEWSSGGIRSPEHWLTAFAGLTWASASDIVRIARRSDELPTMARLIDDGRLTLGQAAVVSKYTPPEFDADVAEFASFATVTQLRRALSRYAFYAETRARRQAHSSEPEAAAGPSDHATPHDPSTTTTPHDPSTTATSPDPRLAADSTPAPEHPTFADASGASAPRTGAFLPADDATDPDKVAAALESAESEAPPPDDPATAPPRLEMRYAEGRFKLTYDAPADIGALVEQALLEAKDALFRLTDSVRPAATTSPTARNADISTTSATSTTSAHALSSDVDVTPNPDSTPATAAAVEPATSEPKNGAPYQRNHEKRWRRTTFADALLLMAQRSLDSGAPPQSSRNSRYRVYLHLDVNGHSWLGGGAAIPPTIRDRLICDGDIQPIWESEGRPVSVGRSQRIVPDRTRRLMEDRDRGCRYPGCLARHHLEAHHLDHWIDGGRTDVDRMLMLCGPHHDAHHRGDFSMVGDPDRPNGVVFCDRDGRPIRPLFAPFGGMHRADASACDDADESVDPLSTAPTRALPRPERHPAPDRRFSRYAGPTNDRLELAWVRFEPAG